MEAPGVVAEIQGPGQFINIAVSDSWDLPLRRPMSIAGVRENRLGIVYKIFGEGTRRLSQKKNHEKANILGPLGNTFATGDVGENVPILVGGGVGIAPILWLHHLFESRRIDHKLIIGAVTSEEHFMDHQPERGIFLTTDDGTKGEKGTVMPTLRRMSEGQQKHPIFACGPEPMLKAIYEFVTGRGIPCQMALESYMGCGTGICQGCVVEKKHRSERKHSYHETYSLVCWDGPVYHANDVRL